MDYSKNKQNELLGVNKMGKNIKKSPLHQPNFGNIPSTQQQPHPQPQPQPQVYNINKNDFRNIVQQLTGSSQEPSRPPQNPAKQQSLRLQRIRPPPLTPINRPHVPPPVPVSMTPTQIPYNNGVIRPAQPQCDQSSTMFHGQPAPAQVPQSIPADSIWPKTAESPISAYMRYLQSSAIDSPLIGKQAQPPPPAQVPGQVQNQVAASGLPPRPNPPIPAAPPSTNGPVPSPPNFPPTQANSPSFFPSPTQFHVPSPSGYLNLLSPQSPYPLLSPGMWFPPPLSPNFAFSPMAQPGILGPGPPHPPLSPGLVFPLSPSGLFPILSPRWRDWQS